MGSVLTALHADWRRCRLLRRRAFLLIMSGFGLYLFGEFHKMIVVTKASELGMFSTAVGKAFPFPNNKFVFNLTHILLFAILISLLSMVHHPAQDAVLSEHEKELKRKAKK